MEGLTSCAANAWMVRSSRSMRTQSAACRSSRSRLRIFFSCSMGTDVVYTGGIVGGRGPWCGPVVGI